MRSAIIHALYWVGIVATFSSCEKIPADTNALLQASFNIALQTQTRAPESINPNMYTAKVYMFKEETSGSNRFVYSGEQSITSSSLNVSGLLPATKYRFVFLAIPKNQQPTLPNFTTTKPSYTNALANYISGSQTENELFRNILSFTATVNLNAFSIVLTRQNGALQIRLNNSNGKIKTAKLEVTSSSQMYLNDGTGGEVLSSGTNISLSKSERPLKTNDYRISINVLPTGDLTGKGRLTITQSNGSQTIYNLQSSSGRIPIYPNQITWIVLGNSYYEDEEDNSIDDENSVIYSLSEIQ